MDEDLLTEMPSDSFLFFLLQALTGQLDHDSDEEADDEANGEKEAGSEKEAKGALKKQNLIRELEKHACLQCYEQGGDDLVPVNLSLLHFTSEELKSIVSDEDYNKATLLHHSAKHGWVDVMESLITKHGLDPKCTDMIKQTPLHYAAKHRQYNVFDMLVSKHKSDPMCEDSKNRNPLYLAAESGCLDIVKYYMVSRLVVDANVTQGGRRLGHIAAEHGHLRVLKYLVAEYKCDVKFCDLEDKTPLHYASQRGHMPMVKYLITECKCDANGEYERTKCKTPVHFAAENGHFDIVKYLALKCECNVSYTTSDGLAPLHSASKHGYSDIVKFLIEECKCNPKCATKEGLTALHYAAMSGHSDIVDFLFSKCDCDPRCVTNNKDKFTPLRYAAKFGHFQVVKFFVQTCGCDPSDGILIAAKYGHFKILKFLDSNHITSADDELLNKCLEAAIQNKHADVVQYLYSKCKSVATFLHKAVEVQNYEETYFLVWECRVDPSTKDDKGKTPLHYAAEQKQFSEQSLKFITCLLSTGLVDPLIRDNNGDTALDIASDEHEKAMKVLYGRFLQAKASYQIDSFVNVFFLGNPGAGKSTLCKVISDTASGHAGQGFVKGVKLCTAGIVPTNLQHKELGNIIVHDLAGHSEFYSSHMAIIEDLLEGSSAVFVIVVDATEKEAVTHLQQWLMTVKNQTENTENKCQIIVVVSHVDRLNDDDDDKLKELQKEVEEKCGKDIPFECLDCRKLGGYEIESFMSILLSSCQYILRENKKVLTVYCHTMYGLLQESEKNVFTLADIAREATMNGNQFFLPVDDGKEILKTLSSLHSTGLIYYINQEKDDSDVWTADHEKVQVSPFSRIWVVKNKEVLLRDVNGVLFAPENFDEYGGVPKNGVVSVAIFNKLFPDYNRVMLVSFLLEMGLCNIVPPSFLKHTNLQLEESSDQGSLILGDVIFLFFPGLMKLERPLLEDQNNFFFGWCLQCTEHHLFFSSRFLHSLSLQLSKKYAVPKQSSPDSSDMKSNLTLCQFWKNGLFWNDSPDRRLGTLVELVDENRCVLVMMSYVAGHEEAMVSLRRKVIKNIVTAQQKYCPSLNGKVEAFVIDPMSLKYPINKPAERDLYSVKKIKQALADEQDSVTSNLNREKAISRILPNEKPQKGSDYSKLSILIMDHDDSSDKADEAGDQDSDEKDPVPFDLGLPLFPPRLFRPPFPPRLGRPPFPPRMGRPPFPPRMGHPPFPPRMGHPPFPPRMGRPPFPPRFGRPPFPPRMGRPPFPPHFDLF